MRFETHEQAAEHFDRIETDDEYKKAWFSALAQTVAVDFDGVIHPYTDGWVGITPADEPPMPGITAFFTWLVENGFRIVVFSTRCDTPQGLEATQQWLTDRGLDGFIDEVTCTKPAAVAYVDDRAVPFAGEWESVRESVLRLASGRAHGAAQ